MSVAGGGEPRIRVVLADDTEDVRLLLRIALSRDGRFEVVGQASNGREAVEAVARLQPDVVLLDLAMPVMDGLQAIPEIRVASPDTRIIVLSGFERSGIEEEVARLGAHGYVEKGKPLDALMAAVEGIAFPAARNLRVVEEPPGFTGEISQDLLSTLGHELSSPVAVIEGFASLMLRDPGALSKEDIADFAEAIARGGKQLQGIIGAFYDARHLGAGELEVDSTDVKLDELVNETVFDLAETVAPSTINVAGVTGVTVRADPIRVRQIVENLVLNAAKFSQPGDPIDVTLGRRGSEVEVAIADRCQGIAPEKEMKLFEKFSKLRKGGPGLGLGLYISRGVARAHGGDLVYEPRAGGGCVFTLRLPG